MVNNKIDEQKVKEALLKRAIGYDYEEKEMVADKNGVSGKVKIIKKHVPPDLEAIRAVLSKIENKKWWFSMNFVEPIRDKDIINKIKKDLYERNEKFYIMFMVGISLGLRISEILQLRVADVKGKKETTIKQPKTGKEVSVAFNSDLLKALNHYCTGRDPHEALIPLDSNEYKPICRTWAYEVLSKISKKYGLENIGTHSMRKTCGYHYYNQTKDIATLMVWFNHASERETLIYIGITRERIKKAMVSFKI